MGHIIWPISYGYEFRVSESCLLMYTNSLFGDESKGVIIYFKMLQMSRKFSVEKCWKIGIYIPFFFYLKVNLYNVSYLH